VCASVGIENLNAHTYVSMYVGLDGVKLQLAQLIKHNQASGLAQYELYRS